MRTDRSLRVYQGIGALLVLLLVGGLVGWAAAASIAGAVIAPASVAVDSVIKKIQHKEGGIVAEIHVRDGDYVEAGALLLRLDDTETRANLAIVDGQLDELLAERARLEADRDEAPAIAFPQTLLDRAGDEDVARILEGQRKLLAASRETLSAQTAQHEQQIAQLEEQIRGLEAQKAAKLQEIELFATEIADLTDLREKGLVPVQRYNALLRERVALEGEAGRLRAEIAKTRSAMNETRLKILQIDQDHRAETLARLTEVRTKVVSLLEQKVAAEAQLKRIDIVAPLSGIVHQVAVHTIGGVIGPGETLMMMVPMEDELVLEARVEPKDVDNIHVGQTAVLRFPAFNQRTTPELFGTVDRVGADLTTDPVSKESFFSVRIRMSAEEEKRLGDNKLHPGMPAEAFIATGDRTALSYLVRPFTDQLNKAFREE